jgi:carboxyl-terminal processing protease
MFFKYANRLATEKRTFPSNGEVTDQTVREFEAFLREQNFRYEEDAEMKVKELREVAQKARYGPSFAEGIERLAKAMETEKGRVFERYDKEIRMALRQEIVNRLRGEKAAIEASMKDDAQLQVAVALVKNKTAYQQLLRPAKR